MTLQENLSTLLGGTVQAKSINRILFAKANSRRSAYDYITEAAKKSGLGVVGLSVLLMKYEDERRKRIEKVADESGLPNDGVWAARELYAAVSAYDEACEVNSQHDLSLLMAEISLLGLKDLPANGNAIAYIDQQRREMLEQLSAVDEETAKKFISLRSHWLRHNLELKQIFALHRKFKRGADSVRRQFMQIFGEEFLAEQAQLSRLRVAESLLRLLKEKPGVNEADIERMLAAGDSGDDAPLSRSQYGLPAACSVSSPGEKKANEDRYTEARSLLRSLASLTHPDKIRNRDLGENQRDQLEVIWHEISPFRAKSSNRTVLVGAIPRLRRNLQLAECILKLAHIEDLDASLVIQGTSLAEQIEWLEVANAHLDRKIRSIEADNLHFSADMELHDMRALVNASPPIQESERQAMVENCNKFKKRAEILEREASSYTSAHH